MKSTILPTLFCGALWVAGATAGEGPLPPPYKGSAEFEKVKALAGEWHGVMTTDKGSVPFTAEFRVTSGGSAVEERLFANSPKEMVSIYHDAGNGKLAMTHYCMLCNRPAMALTKSDDKSVSLELAKDSDLNGSKGMHMHALTLTFNDANHLKEDWVVYTDGKESKHEPFNLERIQKP